MAGTPLSTLELITRVDDAHKTYMAQPELFVVDYIAESLARYHKKYSAMQHTDRIRTNVNIVVSDFLSTDLGNSNRRCACEFLIACLGESIDKQHECAVGRKTTMHNTLRYGVQTFISIGPIPKYCIHKKPYTGNGINILQFADTLYSAIVETGRATHAFQSTYTDFDNNGSVYHLYKMINIAFLIDQNICLNEIRQSVMSCTGNSSKNASLQSAHLQHNAQSIKNVIPKTVLSKPSPKEKKLVKEVEVNYAEKLAQAERQLNERNELDNHKFTSFLARVKAYYDNWEKLQSSILKTQNKMAINDFTDYLFVQTDAIEDESTLYILSKTIDTRPPGVQRLHDCDEFTTKNAIACPVSGIDDTCDQQHNTKATFCPTSSPYWIVLIHGISPSSPNFPSSIRFTIYNKEKTVHQVHNYLDRENMMYTIDNYKMFPVFEQYLDGLPELPKASGGSTKKKHMIIRNVKEHKGDRYITMNSQRVLLSSIRGKYRYANADKTKVRVY